MGVGADGGLARCCASCVAPIACTTFAFFTSSSCSSRSSSSSRDEYCGVFKSLVASLFGYLILVLSF